jgi:hypothetical protein
MSILSQSIDELTSEQKIKLDSLEQQAFNCDTFIVRDGTTIKIIEKSVGIDDDTYKYYKEAVMTTVLKSVYERYSKRTGYDGNTSEYFTGFHIYLMYLVAQYLKISIPTPITHNMTKYVKLLNVCRNIVGVSIPETDFYNILFFNEMKYRNYTITYVPYDANLYVKEQHKLIKISNETEPRSFIQQSPSSVARSARTSGISSQLSSVAKSVAQSVKKSDRTGSEKSDISTTSQIIYTPFTEIIDYFNKNAGIVVQYESLQDLIVENYSKGKFHVASILYKLYVNPSLLDMVNSSNGQVLTDGVRLNFAKKRRYIRKDIDDPTVTQTISEPKPTEYIVQEVAGPESSEVAGPESSEDKGK